MEPAAPSEAVSILARHPLFAHVAPAELETLAVRATSRAYQADEMVFQKGDPGTTMMAVISGAVRICVFSPEGDEIVLAFIRNEEFFGEIALADGGERTADAYAAEATRLLILNRRDLMPFLERHPKVCLKLLEITAARLRSCSVRFEDFIFLDVRTRLAKLLAALAMQGAAEGSHHRTIAIAQHALASMIGTSRQAANKQLREWEKAGIIRLRRGAIEIVDLGRLSGW